MRGIDARLTNMSLLGKLIWYLFNSPHKLWVGILKHKYVKEIDLFHYHAIPVLASFI